VNSPPVSARPRPISRASCGEAMHLKSMSAAIESLRCPIDDLSG